MAPASDRTATPTRGGPGDPDHTAPRTDRPRNDTTRPPGPPARRHVLTALVAIAALVALVAPACRSAPDDATPDTAAAPDGRGEDIPASLRCRQATDCVQKPSCYWESPACVASTDLVAEKCGDDADPKNKDYPPVECACFEGQCTTK